MTAPNATDRDDAVKATADRDATTATGEDITDILDARRYLIVERIYTDLEKAVQEANATSALTSSAALYHETRRLYPFVAELRARRLKAAIAARLLDKNFLHDGTNEQTLTILRAIA